MRLDDPPRLFRAFARAFRTRGGWGWGRGRRRRRRRRTLADFSLAWTRASRRVEGRASAAALRRLDASTSADETVVDVKTSGRFGAVFDGLVLRRAAAVARDFSLAASTSGERVDLVFAMCLPNIGGVAASSSAKRPSSSLNTNGSAMVHWRGCFLRRFFGGDAFVAASSSIFGLVFGQGSVEGFASATTAVLGKTPLPLSLGGDGLSSSSTENAS